MKEITISTKFMMVTSPFNLVSSAGTKANNPKPKLSFVKSVSKVPPSDDSTADGNGNLVLALAAATVHEESVPPVPVFRVHDCQTIILSESDSSSVYIIASNLPLLEPRRKFVDCDQECLQVRLSLALLLLQVHILH